MHGVRCVEGGAWCVGGEVHGVCDGEVCGGGCMV